MMKNILKEKKNLLLLAWPIGLALYLTARYIPGAAEYVYARGLYRAYSFLLSHITGLLPFSLAEVLVISVPTVGAMFILGGTITIIVRAACGKGKTWVSIVSLVRTILIAVGIIYCWYMVGCGTNYYRTEFSSLSGLVIEKSTKEELYELCMDLAQKTNSAREAAVLKAYEQQSMGMANENSDPDSFLYGEEIYASYLTDSERSSAARAAMKKIALEYEALNGYYPRAKSVLLSRVMSEFNITGVYFPWTVEANVNVDVPDYSSGSTLCHELSHLRGFMREDEANYIGYLACINSDEPELVYSGYMSALIYAGNSLYGEDSQLYYEVAATYSRGVIADMVDNSNYWEEFKETTASEVGEKVNDTYLKANNQTDGTKSYGRMVDLLLAEYRIDKK